MVGFLSTLSLRRATAPNHNPCLRNKNFYPRSPCGERPIPTLILAMARLFLSTLSLRRATYSSVKNNTKEVFLSTLSLRRATKCAGKASAPTRYFYPRSPCGERPRLLPVSLTRLLISIHALLAESDMLTDEVNSNNVISIHALLAESDHPHYRNPRRLVISIHALLAESDQNFGICVIELIQFLSTLSLRRATIDTSKDIIKTANFYPRSPCGERPNRQTLLFHAAYFYPRSPCGERLALSTQPTRKPDFYPRSPCGERLASAGRL